MISGIANCGAVALRKTAGGSWTDWRDAWREMGRDEGEIAAEERRRELAAAAQNFVKGAGTGEAQARRRRERERERLHGFTRRRFDARCERLARVSGYIVKALLRGWRRDPLSARVLFRMAWSACVGERLGSEAMARAWRDVWDWVRNIYLKIARERGIEADGAAVSENYLQSYSHLGISDSGKKSECSDGVSARVSKTGKRPIKQCTPLPADAVCGLYGVFRESAQAPSSKGKACSEGAGAERVPRWSGKLPGRCVWRVWEAMEALHAVHWSATEHMWSPRHAFNWCASLLAAGKSLRAAVPLYYDVLISWYGRRVSSEQNFVPSGMFAQLYREAVGLPSFGKLGIRN